jgi:hypothetical protein
MKPKSRVWNYLTKTSHKTVKCSLCADIYKFCNNTTNLRDHLKRKHPIHIKCKSSSENESEQDSMQKRKKSGNSNKLTRFMERNNTYDPDSARNKKLNLKLAFLVASDYEPFSIVKKQGFQEFVQELDPQYVLPSTTHLKEAVFPRLYEILQSKLKSILEEVIYVGITTDTYGHRSMEGFISSTCHFIWNSKLHTTALDTKQIEGAHTAEHQ